MLKHVVTRKIKDPAHAEAHAAEVERALESVRGCIPGLHTIEAGIDIGYDSDADDVVVGAESAERAALDVYRQHPLHQVVKRIVRPLVTGRHVADREC